MRGRRAVRAAGDRPEWTVRDGLMEELSERCKRPAVELADWPISFRGCPGALRRRESLSSLLPARSGW